MILRKIINDLLTEKDHKSYDITRVVTCCGFLCFMILSIYKAINTGEFNEVDFATGFSTILAASGLAIGARSKLEDGNDKHFNNSNINNNQSDNS